MSHNLAEAVFKFGVQSKIWWVTKIEKNDQNRSNRWPNDYLAQKNVCNSLLPPEIEAESLVTNKSKLWLNHLSCSPSHIWYRNMACHTPLESSSKALLGYVTFGSPNQTIWWLGAFKVEQSWSRFSKCLTVKKIIDMRFSYIDQMLSAYFETSLEWSL